MGLVVDISGSTARLIDIVSSLETAYCEPQRGSPSALRLCDLSCCLAGLRNDGVLISVQAVA